MKNVLAERLRESREKVGMSREKVANLLNISIETYGHYERGRNEPSMQNLILLADYFGVSTDYLLGRVDDPGQYIKKVPPMEGDIAEIEAVIDENRPLTVEEIVAVRQILHERGWK